MCRLRQAVCSSSWRLVDCLAYVSNRLYNYLLFINISLILIFTKPIEQQINNGRNLAGDEATVLFGPHLLPAALKPLSF